MSGLAWLGAALLVLLLWAALGGWLAGVLLRPVWALAARHGRPPPAAAIRLTRWALAAALVLGGPWAAFEALQRQAYRDALPPVLGQGTLLWHQTQSGFREGCGVAIYRLDDAALQALRGPGAADWLARARQGRDGRPYHAYAPWRETPAPPEGAGAPALLRGWPCTPDAPPELAAVSVALARPGSHYTTGPEHDLVVVPALGLLVFSYFG